jgi:hypothetical protein
MNLEYEIHNFGDNISPRSYEAVDSAGEGGDLIVKAIVKQRSTRHTKGSKPLLRWMAATFAWVPGQQLDEDWLQLTHLAGSEMSVRDVVPHEATEDTWLTAAQFDAEKLISRSRVFANALGAKAQQRGKRKAA